MPTLCRFLGIVIRMYHKDDGPPHFHAYYGDTGAVIEIETLRVSSGRLPRRALALVHEWAFQHRPELLENWRRAESREALAEIEPLE
jgi:hypothetical protein